MTVNEKYKVLTHGFRFNVGVSGIQLTKDVHDELNRYCLSLPEMADSNFGSGDWELRSHNLALVGNQAVLTIFFARKTT